MNQDERTGETSAPSDPRTRVDRLLDLGNAGAAIAELRRLWRANRNVSSAAFMSARFARIADSEASPIAFTQHKVAILRSFSVEPLVPLLTAEAWTHNIRLSVYTGDFNSWMQDAIAPDSSLYAFQPDTIILAVETRSIAPALWSEPGASQIVNVDWAAEAEAACGSLRQAVAGLRKHCDANIVIHNLSQPDWPANGTLDGQRKGGQRAAVAAINAFLVELSSSQTGVYILDYDALTASYGRRAWYDEVRWLTVRLPFATACMMEMVSAWMQFMCPLAGRISKVCAVDLDNTLWRGIIGEDGMSGIGISQEYPGALYRNLQQALLELSSRGILLAVVSKNNRDDAMEAIEKHPGMLLRPAHFSAMRMNWIEKSANLRDVAAELNLGIDSIAFLDDNPFEREQVEQSLPAVTVVDLGTDAAAFASIVRRTPEFSRLTVSEEDRQRLELYAAHRQTAELRESAGTMEDFLRSLEQVLEVEPVNATTLARAAQMTQKTNQFNLTTRRYTEQTLREMCGTHEWELYTVRVRDRFGDNGVVGLAILRFDVNDCEIDSFLLSCRVINRGVEFAFLHSLTNRARERGSVRMRGLFLPTRKNAPAREFYSQSGFLRKEEIAERDQLWEIALQGENPVQLPDYICLRDAGRKDDSGSTAQETSQTL